MKPADLVGAAHPRPARRVAPGLVIIGLWTLAALVAASQIYVRDRGDTSWLDAVSYTLPSWWIWALLTPICLSLAARYSLAGPAWRSAVAIHIVAGSLVAVTYIALQAPFAVWREGREVSVASWQSAVLGGLAFQFLTQFLIYCGLVAAGEVASHQRRLREREAHAAHLEAELASARLQSLRAQLQPHFLFNTLHTVGGLVRAGESEAALRMLSGLSGLLRYTLDHLDAPEIPLHQEIEAAERYIEIEEVRFQDRLELDRRIDADTAEAIVPALIFQPLLENAMRHGIQSHHEAARVVMGARREGDCLLLYVEDDAGRLPEDFRLDQQSGLGLRLTIRRLERLYGVEQSVSIRNVEPRGVRVEVRLPFREAP